MTDGQAGEPAVVIAAPAANTARARRVRWAVVAGAGLCVVVVALTGWAPSGGAPGTPVPGAPAPAASESPLLKPVDGYRVTFVPEGLRADSHGDGVANYPVSQDRLHNDGSVPGPDHATAAVTTRMYLRSDGGRWLWVTVLRAERTTAGADRALVGDWLAAWAVKGTDVMETYDVPAGRARLVRAAGSETAAHGVVITAPAPGTVITVSGNGGLPVTELKAVAAGIRPRR